MPHRGNAYRTRPRGQSAPLPLTRAGWSPDHSNLPAIVPGGVFTAPQMVRSRQRLRECGVEHAIGTRRIDPSRLLGVRRWTIRPTRVDRLKHLRG